MTDETLTLWENGAVTLPKEWRERYGTRHFLAKEDKNGYLVIMPILDAQYYEESDQLFGIRFPTGIEMNEFVKIMDTLEPRIYGEEMPRKASSKRGKVKRRSRKCT